jgi:hypothetical protein
VNSETSSVLGGAASYSGTSQSAVNAGSYVITPSGYTSGNYDITYANGTLTVGKAALTITATNATKTYDGLAFTGGNGVTFSGFVNSETDSVLGGSVAYSGTSQGAVNAGNYVVTPSGFTSNNYAITYVDGLLTVGKARLTVTPSGAKTYDGQPFFGGTATYTGFVNGETPAVLTGSVVYGGSAQGATAAGTYGITASGLGAANYDITFDGSGLLTIAKAPLTITATNATKTYDGLAFAGGNGVTFSGFVNSETDSVLGGAVAYSGTSQSAKDVGTYVISPSGFTSNNYAISYVDGALSVTPASLIVTALNATKTYDGLAFTGGNGVTFSGFVNSETDSVLGGAAAYAGNSQSAKDVGTYVISPSGFTSNNYAISYVDGWLSVGKAPLTVTAVNLTKTYDGKPHVGGNGVVFNGLAAIDASTDFSASITYGGSSQGAVVVGVYSLVPSGLSLLNYDITFLVGSLSIEAALQKVSPISFTTVPAAPAYVPPATIASSIGTPNVGTGGLNYVPVSEPSVGTAASSQGSSATGGATAPVKLGPTDVQVIQGGINLGRDDERAQ